MMYVKLKGAGHVEVRTERVIQVSMTLAMSLDNFYNTQARAAHACKSADIPIRTMPLQIMLVPA